MLDQIKSLSTAINTHNIASEWWDTWWIRIDIIIKEAVANIWNILWWKEKISIRMIMDSFDRINPWQNGEYEWRTAIMQKAYSTWNKADFIIQMLYLFWFSNPESFILNWRVSPVVQPILGTNIKISVILRSEKEQERSKSKVWPDLEGISAIISSYNPTYEALISRKIGIHTILHDELIMPLAEDSPFIQKQYWALIAGYDKKENKLTEIADLERKIVNLGILKSRGMTNAIKKAESQITRKMSELTTITEQIREIKDPFSLEDIVIYIQRKFWYYIRKKKASTVEKPDQIITSQKIKSKIRRGISIWVHRNEELKKIRINAWAMNHMVKMFEKIIEKYTKLSTETDDPIKKLEVVAILKDELDVWEMEANSLIDKFSLSHIRRLRDQIIETLLSKK